MIPRIAIALGLGISCLAAQWPTVPAWDFSASSAAAFADHELDVPYHLRHFAQVANAVVENPFTDGTGTYIPRGFLNIKVNREPVDNKPYNARIMEMQAVLAYFYTVDRPWNPYRGSTAVRVRLEAMLQRWTEMQAPPGHSFAGLFTEYSSSNWSLAPTGFGVRHAAEALDLIVDSGLPFDATILENSRVSLRRALIATFTRTDIRNAAKLYSNQFSGAYHAALIYLENWPDAELDSAFVSALNAATTQDQSPAGFWYEQGGPDFGYTNVHDSNMRIALPRMRKRADLMPVANGDDAEWNQWLGAQLVIQPGLATRTFFINGGVNTRTSDSTRTPNSRPWSEFVESSRIFSLTDAEFTAATAARRSQVQSQFGNWGALAVPSSSSYIPSFVHDAVTPLNVWHPSAALRDAAQAGMACLSPVSLNRLYRDPFPTSFSIAKRPQYFAAVTTGNIRVSRQTYGLGLLWNPSFGVALQSVAGTLSSNNWLYGTRRSGTTATYETANIPATITAGGTTVSQSNGITTLPQGDLAFRYELAASGTTYGQKTITLGESRVDVSLTHNGSFTEMLPLAHADDAILANTGSKLTLTRPNGSSFIIEVTTPGAVISTGATGGIVSGMTRRAVTISANDSLSYSLTVSDANPSPPETTSPGKASTPPGSPLDIDLRAFVSDRQTPDENLFFVLGQATGGSVILLDDGFTARFTPAEGFAGSPSFAYSVRDQGNDPRLIRHYRFESPDASTDGLATDASASSANGELATAGGGTATYQNDAPPPFPSGESRSLRLAEADAANFARLRTTVSTVTRDLSNQDWTASFWFKRATGNTHDFLFYIGSGNGFSGEGHELEIFAPANANTLRMQYWDGSNVKQADLTSSPVATVGQWCHAAAVWQAAGAGQGTLTLYLNGQPVGSASFAAAFKQSSPLVFGGTQISSGDPRQLDGWLDDVALYSAALDAGEIAGLASQPAANHAGLGSDGLLEISIDPLSGGLGGHWTFENDLIDVSGRAWQLLASAGAGISTGRSKQAAASLALPLEGDYVASAIPIPLGDTFTLASWVYLPSGQNSIRTIAANSPSGFNANGFRFFVNRFNAANAELVLETGNGSQATIIVSPAGAVATDRWQHVAAVVDRAAGQATIHVNGSQVASGEVRTDFNNNALLALGAMVGGLHGLRGNIDDFRIYSRLLNAAELTTVFAAANDPPVVTPPAALTMAAGSVSNPLAVTLDDMESGPAALVLTAFSSDPALLPAENIILGGEGANRTVIVNPVAWRGGVAAITLTASDGVSAASASFQVTVTNNGYPALWTATTTGEPLAWSTAGNWSMAIPPFPGAACDLDFLSGTVAPAGMILAGQDIAMPFTARSLRLGGSGAATLRIGGPSLALVDNGSGTSSIALDATGVMAHEVETPIQLANNCTVSGNGDASFVFRSEISGTGGLVKTGSSSLVLDGANTFVGGVSIQSGVLRASHDSALGSAAGSTLVQGGTALAALEVADGITTGEPIQLVMQNTVGHTQLRNVSGSNTLTGQLLLNGGGARWDITSLAGWLDVAGPVTNIANPANPDTWRKLYLSGPAGGSFSGTMTDAAKSKLNLVISSGEWCLTGVSKAYTGTTEVAAGKLVVETSLQSNVIVSAGAVLRGQGGSTSSTLSLQNDAVIAIAPLSWDAPPAPFTAGQLQIARAVIRVDASQLAGFTETARSFPLIQVPSGIGSPDPALLSFDASGFPGTGRWTVVTSPTSLSLAYQPDLYQSWSDGIDWQGADSSLTADAERDGITNLMEYALGGNPLRSDHSILPAARLESGTLVLSFQRAADPDLLYEVQASSDLTKVPGAWQTIWSSTGPANLPGVVEVPDTPPSPAPLLRFLRLRVSRSAGFEMP